MFKRSLFFLCMLNFSLVSLFAQETVSDTLAYSLSLEEAQKIAVERNRTLMNASLDVQSAQANHWKAIASMLPQASASADYSNMLGYEINLGTFQIAMPASVQLGINTAVALSGAQVVSTQLTALSKKMADVSLLKSEQDICDQTKVLYYSALVSEETENLLEKNLESLKTLHQFSLKTVQVGVSEQTDADQILVQVSTMETSLNNVRRSKEMVYNSLRLLLNLDVNSDIVLTQTLNELVNAESSLALLYEEFVPERNYDFQLIQKSTELSKKQVAMAGWAYGPTLSVFYQYTYKKYFSDEATMNMTPPNMLGATLSVPIFSSGVKYSALKDAKLAYKKQMNTLADTEDALKIQHRQLCYNLASAFERFETQQENVAVSQRVFDNMGKKYEHGMVSSIDVTTSGTNLINAQNSYVQAMLDFVNAQIQLETLLNK